MKLFQEMHDNDHESFIKSFRVNPDKWKNSERLYWSSTDFRSTAAGCNAAALVIGQFLAALRKK